MHFDVKNFMRFALATCTFKLVRLFGQFQNLPIFSSDLPKRNQEKVYERRSVVYSYLLPKPAQKPVSATLCLAGWWKNSNAWRETLEECFLCFDLTSLDVGYLGLVSLTYLGTACLF